MLNVPCNFTTLRDERRRSIRTEQQRCLPTYFQTLSQRREYHVTKKQEIVPLIAVAAIVLVGVRYSYRAIQRMRDEQEEYQYELQLYERQQMKQQAEDGSESSASPNTEKPHSGSIITLAIDLGTIYAKLAAATYNPSSTVSIQISREGDRSFFNGVLYESGTIPGNNSIVRKSVKAVGRAALERFYFPNTMESAASQSAKDTVSVPFFELTSHLVDKSAAGSQVISDVLKSRISEVLDRIHSSSSISNALVRHIVTVPCVFLTDEETVNIFSKAFDDCCSVSNDADTSSISLIPEPVAAVWGAQFFNLLPTALPKDMAALASYCVLDVGGYTTQISVVQNDRVLYSSTIPWGGENIIEQMVLVLKNQAAEPCNDSRSLSLLQYHARQAVMELSTQSRVAVHVPYLYANPAQHHLDTSFARTVLQQTVEHHVRALLQEQPDWLPDGILSPHLPKPNDLTSLWTSILTQVFERSKLLPTDVSAVLVVGGGAKTLLIQQTMAEAWNRLTGGASSHGRNALVTNTDPSLVSEFTVVGAATLPPSFDYSWTRGLVRRY